MGKQPTQEACWTGVRHSNCKTTIPIRITGTLTVKPCVCICAHGVRNALDESITQGEKTRPVLPWAQRTLVNGGLLLGRIQNIK